MTTDTLDQRYPQRQGQDEQIAASRPTNDGHALLDYIVKLSRSARNQRKQ